MVKPVSLSELSVHERSISLDDTARAAKPLGVAGVPLGLAVGVGVDVGVTVGVGVDVAVTVGVGVTLGVGLGEGVGEPLLPAVALAMFE
jgi:hypothetical protein